MKENRKKTLSIEIEISEDEFEETHALVNSFLKKGIQIIISVFNPNGNGGWGELARGKCLSQKIKPSPKKPGFVYFIKSDHGYKIGRTKNLEKRVTSIISSLPFAASLDGYIETDDSVGVERSLHQVFKDRRVGGEWFNINGQDVCLATCDHYEVFCGEGIL